MGYIRRTMTLADYLASRGCSWHAASMELKISYASIHRLKGGARPSVNTAKAIEAWSGGQVTAAELLDLAAPPAPARPRKPRARKAPPAEPTP